MTTSRSKSGRKKQQQLTPGAIAKELFCLDPDRDERSPQLCAETLLTLSANGYEAPPVDEFRSPKRQRFAIRSLAIGTNFLGGQDEGHAGDDQTTPAEYGASLAAGLEVRGSSHLRLAQQTLQGLVDPDTQRGQPGAWLLRPFHESLLWYDARKASPSRYDYTVRKVYMRGSGITLAKLLLDPPDPAARDLGRAAVSAIRDALTSASPLSAISAQLEGVLPREGEATYTTPPAVEDDEWEAWERGRDERLSQLGEQLCRHAEGVMLQNGTSAPAKLWQLRTILALDLAAHVMRTAWTTTNTPAADQFLLLSFGNTPRPLDPVRQRSEDSYRKARIRLSEATVGTLARRMSELHREGVDWASQFQTGSALRAEDDDNSIANQLAHLAPDADNDNFLHIARAAVEVANYSRGAEDGFRVLLESIGSLVGTGAYRYLTAGPDLLAALVGALSAQMPMPSRDFFKYIRQEWGFVINQESASETSLASQLDGTGLERNARRAEKLMSDAGLALALSDRTTMVGVRASRSGS